MAADEDEHLEELWDEILVSDLPEPELMARHAQSPNSLSAEERLTIDSALARSAAARDELDTLQSFDFSQLNADLEQPAPAGIGSTLRRLLSHPASFALAGGVAALLAWVVIDPLGRLPLDESGNPNGPEPAFAAIEAEKPAADAPSAEAETSTPFEAAPIVEEAGSQLAATRPPVLDPELNARPSIQVAKPPPERAKTLPPRDEYAEPQPEMLLAMNMPVYQRPSGTMDRALDIGGYRSERPDSTLQLEALAPNHAGRSLTPSPRLFWRLNEVPEGGAFSLDIVSTGSPQTAVVEELPVPRPAGPGIQEIDLADLGVALETNEEYRWSIAHRVDEWAPPTAFAIGWIRYAPTDDTLSTRLADAPAGDRPAIFADSGYWYDALSDAIDLMRSHPGQTLPGTVIQALLDQANRGLTQD